MTTSIPDAEVVAMVSCPYCRAPRGTKCRSRPHGGYRALSHGRRVAEARALRRRAVR